MKDERNVTIVRNVFVTSFCILILYLMTVIKSSHPIIDIPIGISMHPNMGNSSGINKSNWKNVITNFNSFQNSN